MTEIIIGGIVLFVIFLIRQNYLDNKRQEELRQKKILDEQKRKQEEERNRKAEIERKRLEELKYESPTVVFASNDDNGKPTAILKRSNNTYCSVERPDVPFEISEKIKLEKETINNWIWFDETEYKRQLVSKQRQELERKQKFETEKKQADFLKSFGIDYLYHMTHKNNLQNILHNGLQSHNYARTKQLTQVDIADNQVNDRRSRLEPIYNRSIHDYVPLYFNPKNPMLYRRSNLQNDIVILAIDKNILHQANTLFTNGNAAANATLFFKQKEDLSKLNWSCINADYWNDILDGKRIRCAEVLAYPNIPTSSIQKIFCNNLATRQFIESKTSNHSHIKAEINPNLYFSGVNNQQANNNSFPNTFNSSFSIDPIDDLPF